MTRITAQRLFLLLIVALSMLALCSHSAEAAPYAPVTCKLDYDRALVLVHGSGDVVDAAVGQLDIQPTTAREDFFALPRVVTVTLFHGDTFAGLLDVRGRGDVLRIRVRNAKDLDACYSGEIDAAIVMSWIAR